MTVRGTPTTRETEPHSKLLSYHGSWRPIGLVSDGGNGLALMVLGSFFFFLPILSVSAGM